MKMTYDVIVPGIKVSISAEEIPLDVFHSLLHDVFRRRLRELPAEGKDRDEFVAAAGVILASFKP